VTDGPDNTVVRFGTFELDLKNEQLRKGGLLVKLPPQPLKILVRLSTHAGQLVTRQELRDQLWGPETFVDFEQGLNYCIKQIRLALGDDSDSPRFIETIPKRGYRFIAAVRLQAGRADGGATAQAPDSSIPRLAAPAIPTRHSLRVLQLLLVAGSVIAIVLAVPYLRKTTRGTRQQAAPAPVTLAVLPFDVLNRQEDIGHLAIAIPDAITARLARAGQIRVRPTTAVLHSDTRKRELADVARVLVAEYLLTGTLQEIGDNLRVNVQLVRGTDTVSLWGEHYDLPVTNLLILEDTISEKVVGALRIPVSTAERARLHRRYTSNPEAYESYLKGRSELLRYTKDGTSAAIKSFDTALQLEPSYVLAHAGLASASAQMHLRFAPENEVNVWLERAQREAGLALDLDSDLAEVHEALAAVYGQTDFDWPRTIDESRRALALNPSLPMPHYYIARAFYHLGLLEMVEGEVRAGLDIDPVNRMESFRLRGTAALVASQFDNAKQWLEEARKLSAPTVTDWYFAQALYYSGDYHGAEELLRTLHGSAQAEQRARATLASFLAARGDTAEAESLVDRALATGYMDHHVAYSIGVAYAQLGQPQRALTWLGKATDTGFTCYPWFSRDPLLQPLRSNPEFNRLLSYLKDDLAAARTRYK
jgi:DNA-binding winged helix-turn-helix (wHTH) protein/TolB-like protein/tetratricopeptide (TPR) repeat protein